MGGRRSHRLGALTHTRITWASHQRRHKSRVSLRGPPWAHGVSNTPYGEVRDIGDGSIDLDSAPATRFPLAIYAVDFVCVSRDDASALPSLRTSASGLWMGQLP